MLHPLHPNQCLDFVDWYCFIFLVFFVHVLIAMGTIRHVLCSMADPSHCALVHYCIGGVQSRLADYCLITASRKRERSSQLQGRRSSYRIRGKGLWATYKKSSYILSKSLGYMVMAMSCVEWREYYRLAMIHLWVSEKRCALLPPWPTDFTSSLARRPLK